MARAETAVALIAVEVAWCPAPHRIDLTPLQLPAGATVRDALQASGVLQRAGLDLQAVQVGVWGRACGLDQGLRERDRVEIYRPLQVDPKEARRQRYKGKREGKRSAVSGSPTR
jgi:putative ubiquitin-RnfH superfamily antitoxin RatB of RatAB toxin-antitoxin module